VLKKAHEIKDQLIVKNVRVHIDDRDQMSPGAKFFSWELKGVPVRIEIGPKDVEKNQAVLVNRIEQDRTKKKSFENIDAIGTKTLDLLEIIQNQLFAKAKDRQDKMWHQVDKLEKFGPILEKENGFYQAGWCGNAECEVKLKEFKGTIRCLLKEKTHDSCFCCQKSSKTDVLIAKSY